MEQSAAPDRRPQYAGWRQQPGLLAGIPVVGHVGLTPQTATALGGYKAQGRSADRALAVARDALALQDAGAGIVVLECVPRSAATALCQVVRFPVIGIGAGPDCAGQVLVLYDVLGIQPTPPARFVRNFMQGSEGIEAAVSAYVAAVKDGSFPAAEHCF